MNDPNFLADSILSFRRHDRYALSIVDFAFVTELGISSRNDDVLLWSLDELIPIPDVELGGLVLQILRYRSKDRSKGNAE